MGTTLKVLAQGQLAATTGVLYTGPASTTTIIKEMSFVNNDTEDLTFELYQDGTTEATRILPTATIEAGGWAQFNGAITVDAAGTIQGKASQATEITYTIWGMEVT